MEPRRKLSSIKVIFVDGFLSNNFTTKLGVPSTLLFLDSYHLLNCIWPDALGERAYNLVKEHLQTMVFCHSQQDYDRAFTEIITKLQHMPEKLAQIEEYYGNPSIFACYKLMTVRGTMCKRGSAHAEQNHASIDTHIPTFGGILEPEVFIEKLILRHDEWVSKHEKLRRDVLFTSSAMACNTADKTLSSAVQNLSRYSYEIFKKEYFGAQKYIGESRECNYNIEEYVILQTACDGTRCAKPRCVSMDFQCRHELAASMVSYDDNGRTNNLFDIAKFGSRHLQQHIYLKITQQPIDNEDNYAEGVTQPIDNEDNYAEGVTFQAEVHESNQAFIEKPVTLAKEASDEVAIDKPVTVTKAGSTAYYTYSDVIKEAKNLASTIQGDKIKTSAMVQLLRAFTSAGREDKAFASEKFLKSCEASLDILANNNEPINNEAPLGSKSSTVTGIRYKRLKPMSEIVKGKNKQRRNKTSSGQEDCDAGEKAVLGCKRISTCTFCNNTGHRKGTCEKRIKYGRYLKKGCDTESFPVELTSMSSTLLPPSQIETEDIGGIVLESLPKRTNHIVILNKAIINPFLDKSTEDNLAISIYCIGHDGERLQHPYNGRLLIQATKLRKWVSQNATNVEKIILAHEKAIVLQSQLSKAN